MIKDRSDHNILQDDINSLVKWCETWELPINSTKTKILRLTRKRDENISHFIYKVNGIPVLEVSSAKYLGVIIDSKLNWDYQIEHVYNKASSALGFIRRNFRNSSSQALKIVVNALVNPHLNYCSTVWDPHKIGDIRKLESIQRRSARMISKNWSRQCCVTELIQNLGWTSLQTSRRENRLTSLYSIYHGHTILDPKQFFTPPDYMGRRDHQKKVKLTQTHTNYFRYSFIPRTIFEWNDLPSDIVDSSTETLFKNKLINIRPKDQCSHTT